MPNAATEIGCGIFVSREAFFDLTKEAGSSRPDNPFTYMLSA